MRGRAARPPVLSHCCMEAPAPEVDLTFRAEACTLFSVSFVNFTTATTTTTRFGGRGTVCVAW